MDTTTTHFYHVLTLGSWALILSLVLSAWSAWADFRGLSMITAFRVLRAFSVRYIILTLMGSKPSTGWKALLDSMIERSSERTSWTRKSGCTIFHTKPTGNVIPSPQVSGTQAMQKPLSGQIVESPSKAIMSITSEPALACEGRYRVENTSYWYTVDLRTALARTKTIFGKIEAMNPYAAMDKIEANVKRDYHARVIKARLHEVNTDTGEYNPEACLLMDNVLEGGGLHRDHKVEGDPESSHASEEKKGTPPVPAPEFSAGWGKAVTDNVSVTKDRFK